MLLQEYEQDDEEQVFLAHSTESTFVIHTIKEHF